MGLAQAWSFRVVDAAGRGVADPVRTGADAHRQRRSRLSRFRYQAATPAADDSATLLATLA